MPINRSLLNAAIESNGTPGHGTVIDRAFIADRIFDPIDAAILGAAVPVVFPATHVPSADANTLDDYEEGPTWTPSDASGAGLALTFDSCTYIKIGQLVIASFKITYPATADGTGARIGGLPFTARNTTNNVFGGIVTVTTETTATGFAVVSNSTTFKISNIPANADVTNATMSGDQIRGTVIYFAAA